MNKYFVKTPKGFYFDAILLLVTLQMWACSGPAGQVLEEIVNNTGRLMHISKQKNAYYDHFWHVLAIKVCKQEKIEIIDQF